MLRRDAHAGIFNTDHDGRPVASRRAHRDEPTRGRVPDRVANQIRQDLSDPYALNLFVVGEVVPPWIEQFIGADAATLIERDSLAMVRGTPRQIADELFLSVEGVKTQVRALFERFGVEDLPQNRKRARLVELAFSSGTVSDEDFAAIKAAGYSDVQLVEISLAFATTVFTNVFNRINDTAIDFPAVA